MGMTAFYGTSSEEASLATIDRALELGLNFLDTAFIYCNSKGESNEELIAKAIAKHGRDKLIIATKFGIDFSRPSNPFDSSPEAIRSQLATSLKRLGTDYVDLYYQHRADPSTPVETVMKTLKELHAEGKIRYAGLSECSSDELRRAHAVFPVSAIQMEWSLQSRDLEATIIPTARELGVGIVAYSPLGRGLLTGAISSVESLDPTDWRRNIPRFQPDTIAANAKAAENLAAIAARKGCTPGQLALAWVQSRGKDVVPIPGTRSAKRLEENIGAVAIADALTPAEIAEIEAAVPEVKGDRYDEGMMKATFNAREGAAATAASSAASRGAGL